MNRRENRWTNRAYWALWTAAVALYVVWSLTHLGAYAWSNDEGLYAQRAALANEGHPLYTETFLNKPPLYVWILQLAFRVAGRTLAVARLSTLCLTLIGFIALATAASQLWGRWAGLASAWVLLGLPEVPVRAHALMSDLPAMAFALVALGTALSFRRGQQRAWIALSGAAFAGALLVHPLLIYMVLPLTAALILPGLSQATGGSTARASWGDLAVFGGVVIGLGLIVLVVMDWQALVTSVIEYNVGAVYTNIEFAGPGKNQAIKYLQERWTLVWLAIAGTAALCTRSGGKQGLLVTATWFFATAATIVAWSPVWNHYMLFLALPLTAVAGGGLATVTGWVFRGYREGRPLTWWRTVLTALTFVGVVIFIGHRCGERMPQPEGGPEWSRDSLAARTFLKATTPPNSFVVTDDPLLAFTAGRLVPPALTGASYKKIRLGYLTAEDLVENTLHYRAQAVLFATGRLALLSAYDNWVAAVATGKRKFGPLRTYLMDLPPSPLDVPVSYLSDEIVLDGYTLSSYELRPGGTLTVTLLWRQTGPVADDYTVFVHLVDGEDQMWGQHDGPPLIGAYPTSLWVERLLLPDPHPLLVSSEAPPGRYHLMVGMYRWPSLERLPAFLPGGSRWPDDRIRLTELHLTVPGD